MKKQVTNINSDPILEAAKILTDIGEDSEAIKLIRKVLEKCPNNIDAAIQAGLLYQKLGNNKNAKIYFRKALSINSDYPKAIKTLGLFELDIEKTKNGLDTLYRYLAMNNWDDLEVLNKIYEFTEEENIEKSMEIIKYAWEHTLHPRVGFLYSRILRTKGENSKGLEILQIIAKVSPELDILSELSVALIDDNQYKNAIPVIKQIILSSDKELEGIDPGTDIIHGSKSKLNIEDDSNKNIQNKFGINLRTLLAFCYYSTNDYDLAHEEINQAIDIDPNMYITVRLKILILITLEERKPNC